MLSSSKACHCPHCHPEQLWEPKSCSPPEHALGLSQASPGKSEWVTCRQQEDTRQTEEPVMSSVEKQKFQGAPVSLGHSLWLRFDYAPRVGSKAFVMMFPSSYVLVSWSLTKLAPKIRKNWSWELLKKYCGFLHWTLSFIFIYLQAIGIDFEHMSVSFI